MELYLTEKDRRKLGVNLPVLEKVLEGYEMKKMMQDLMNNSKLNVNTLNRTVNEDKDSLAGQLINCSNE